MTESTDNPAPPPPGAVILYLGYKSVPAAQLTVVACHLVFANSKSESLTWRVLHGHLEAAGDSAWRTTTVARLFADALARGLQALVADQGRVREGQPVHVVVRTAQPELIRHIEACEAAGSPPFGRFASDAPLAPPEQKVLAYLQHPAIAGISFEHVELGFLKERIANFHLRPSYVAMLVNSEAKRLSGLKRGTPERDCRSQNQAARVAMSQPTREEAIDAHARVRAAAEAAVNQRDEAHDDYAASRWGR